MFKRWKRSAIELGNTRQFWLCSRCHQLRGYHGESGTFHTSFMAKDHSIMISDSSAFFLARFAARCMLCCSMGSLSLTPSYCKEIKRKLKGSLDPGRTCQDSDGSTIYIAWRLFGWTLITFTCNMQYLCSHHTDNPPASKTISFIHRIKGEADVMILTPQGENLCRCSSLQGLKQSIWDKVECMLYYGITGRWHEKHVQRHVVVPAKWILSSCCCLISPW